MLAVFLTSTDHVFPCSSVAQKSSTDVPPFSSATCQSLSSSSRRNSRWPLRPFDRCDLPISFAPCRSFHFSVLVVHCLSIGQGFGFVKGKVGIKVSLVYAGTNIKFINTLL
jgi:hypothetical protein